VAAKLTSGHLLLQLLLADRALAATRWLHSAGCMLHWLRHCHGRPAAPTPLPLLTPASLPAALCCAAEAQAVLSWGGPPVRATFTFDRWGRVARFSSHDFLRRLPDGSFEQGEWQVAYSGHMLFG